MTEQEYIRRAEALKEQLYRTAALYLGSPSDAVDQQQKNLPGEHSAPAFEDIGRGLRCTHGKDYRRGEYHNAQQHIPFRSLEQ